MSTGAILAAILPSTAAHAQSFFGLDLAKNNYVQGNLGAAYDGQTHVRSTAGSQFKGDASNRPDFFASGLVGHSFSNGFSVEGEALYAGTDIGRAGSNAHLPAGVDRSVDTYGGTVNVKYSLPLQYHISRFGISPYVAAGVGYGGVSYNLGDYNERDSGLLWQAKAGIDVKVSQRLTLDFGYRYVDGPQLEPEGRDTPNFTNVNLSTHQHVASIGARWHF